MLDKYTINSVKVRFILTIWNVNSKGGNKMSLEEAVLY